jgi:hypothetical protein
MRILLCLLLFPLAASAATLYVGTGQTYPTVTAACQAAKPGDTVFIHNGTYTGTFWIEGVQGAPNAAIVICGEDADKVIFSDGSESMHLSDCAYLTLEQFTVTQQTGNGLNIDDAGTIDTPTHHINVRGVRFQQMGATGNNDFLKLSGLEDFLVELCTFTDGAAGGSGIDMVGCHRGLIRSNTFTNLGSNSIQAKGGTQFIRIERNTFTNGGSRGVNLGGSTGLAFFRPIDAPFEAADLQVYCNVFEGSQAPVAFVGCVRVDVANNVFHSPGKWAFRILQETVEPTTRFAKCGNNWFRNNIVVYSAGLSPLANIGPNTAPETFTVSNNLWFDGSANTTSPMTGMPFTETNAIAGSDPRIPTGCPISGSPVIGKGTMVPNLTTDFFGKPFGIPPSIGACETGQPTDAPEPPTNPFTQCVSIVGFGGQGAVVDVAAECGVCVVDAYDVLGRRVDRFELVPGRNVLGCDSGWMFLRSDPSRSGVSKAGW